MSLSTITTRCHPPVCRHPRHGKDEPPPAIDWKRVRDATLATAAATLLSQVPAAPLDLASKLVIRGAPGAPQNLFAGLLRLFATQGFRGAFRNLGMSCMKRVPTKTLTVAFFEIGTQLVLRKASQAPSSCSPSSLTPVQHLAVAVGSGALGLALTFPLHSLYYANRKGVACASVLTSFSHRWPIMFSGALPALMSTPPAVMVDYSVYKRLRSHIDEASDRTILSLPQPVWIVAAATAANLTGGILVEPFKALSRRMAIESVKSVSCGSMSMTARTMLKDGVGEFWRGYRMRMVRYAVSAVVSKTAVRQLRRRTPAKIASSEAAVFVLPERRVLQAHMLSLGNAFSQTRNSITYLRS